VTFDENRALTQPLNDDAEPVDFFPYRIQGNTTSYTIGVDDEEAGGDEFTVDTLAVKNALDSEDMPTVR
jgi:hypothetical protein